MSEFHIPRKGEMVPIGKTGGKPDIKPQIESALNDNDVIEKLEAYKTNGGVAGDARIDDVRAMDVILAYDLEHGDAVSRSGLKQAEIMQQVNVVLRRHFLLDKHRKIIGINEKRFKLLPRPVAAP